MPEAIRVVGVPAVRRGGTWVPLPLDLRTALLGVLAVSGAPVTRDRLAAVFWPDAADRRARQNLRQLLHRARQLLDPGPVVADAATVHLACASDLGALRSAEVSLAPRRYAELARCALLDGLEQLDNAEWQAWLELERRALDEEVRRALLEAAGAWSVGPPPTGGLHALAAWVDRDPFDDDLLLAYLRCARTVPGEASAAAARLGRAARAYDQELGLPLPEHVVGAAEWLEAPHAAAAPAVGAAAAPSSAAASGLGRGRPGALPLVGREQELRALDEAVLDPEVRVVTVHGLGGIGKTRLARAWVELCGDRRGQRIPWLALAGSATPQEASRRLAAAAGWRSDDHLDAAALGALLQRRTPALVVDEADGRPWIGSWLMELIGGGPALTVVVTSRERLGIDGEHLLRLSGLATVPGDGEGTGSALRLFLHAARRTRPDAPLDDRDRRAAARFAARVGGSPLALIVAAGWLQLGPPAVVLERLQGDDDPLSLGDVLAPSWDRLAAAERHALEALSTFPGRFDLDAALAVAGTDRRTLRTLVDVSLLEPGTERGLTMHALVREDARRRLAARPEAHRRARAAHAAYVAERLGDRAASLYRGRDQLQVHHEVVLHIEDVRRAWSYACGSGDAALLDRLLDLVWSCELSGWYALGAELTGEAVAALDGSVLQRPEAERVLARALARQGIFAMRRGDAALTRSSALRAQRLFERLGGRMDPFVYFHLGIAALLDDDLPEAERWHRVLLEQAQAAGDLWAEAGARANLAYLQQRRGDPAGAVGALEAALAVFDPALDRWGTLLGSVNLGRLLLHLGGADERVRDLADSARALASTLGKRSLECLAEVLFGLACARLGDGRARAAAFARAAALYDAGALDGLDEADEDVRMVRETLERHGALAPPPTPPGPGVTPASRPAS